MQNETSSQGLEAYRKLLRQALTHKSYFGLAFVGMLMFAASEGAFAYLIKPMLDQGFVHRDPLISKLVPVAIILLFVVRIAASFMRTYFMDLIGRSVIMEMRRRMFAKLTTLHSSEYDRASSGEFLTKFSFDVEQMSQAVSVSLTILIQDSLRIIVLLSYMLWLNLTLTTIFLLGGPLAFYIVVRVSSRFRKISRRIQASMGQVSHVAEEVIESNRVVKIYSGQQFEIDKFERINNENLIQNMKMSFTRAISMPVIQLIVATAFAAIVAVASSASMQDSITPGDFMSFIFAMTMLFAPMRNLSSINAEIQKGIAAGESVFELLDMPSEQDQGQIRSKPQRMDLVFDQVSFNYASSPRLVLDQISFSLPAGKTLALVGQSGSGKSTLANLLPRLYEPTSGRILLDQHDIRDYTLQTLREQIAYVGQDVKLFNDTVRNNVAYGLSGIDDEQIKQVLKQAHALEFVEQMEQGIHTLIGENGVLLSGGQRQRLAIARALLKDAPILILDEATSALDTESERHIQEALELLMQNRSTLVIAHRLSTIESADQIVVMEQGKIIETGTHTSLLRKQGSYARLHALQFRDSE